MSPEMRQLVEEGYFVKVAQGDTRAASLFARLVAFRMNQNGDPSKPGCLRKTGGGHNVDGYAEDAIVLNGNPSDLFNVVDLVSGAGAAGASPTWNGPLPRRSSDVWEAPQPLSADQLSYLKGGAAPMPQPPRPPAPPPIKSREQFRKDFEEVNTFYASMEGLQRIGGMVAGVDASVFHVFLRLSNDEALDDLAIRNAAKAVLNVRCDVQSMIQWGYDLMTGASALEVIKRIRDSEEWKSKHPAGIADR